MKSLRNSLGFFILGSAVLLAQEAQPPAPATPRPERPPRPGVSTPGVKRDISTLKPIAVFPAEGTPDWQVVTEDAVVGIERPEEHGPSSRSENQQGGRGHRGRQETLFGPGGGLRQRVGAELR
jgi:hypothetical protein